MFLEKISIYIKNRLINKLILEYKKSFLSNLAKKIFFNLFDSSI